MKRKPSPLQRAHLIAETFIADLENRSYLDFDSGEQEERTSIVTQLRDAITGAPASRRSKAAPKMGASMVKAPPIFTAIRDTQLSEGASPFLLPWDQQDEHYQAFWLKAQETLNQP